MGAVAMVPKARVPRSDQLLEEIEQAANVGIWEWDPQEPTAWWSPQLYRIYGETPATYTPSYEAYLTKVHPEDRDRVRRATEAVFRDHRSYSHDERILRPNGEVRYLHTWAHAVVRDGRLERLVGVCQDVTETRKLRELGEFKSQFLRAVGHELGTPLTPLRVQLRLLADGKLGPLNAAQVRSIDMLERNLERFRFLVSDIQDVARIESGRLELQRQPFPLQEAVKEAVDLFAGAATAQGVRLEAGPDPGLVVQADRHRIVQVLVNYVSNALKFTPRDGTVRVEARGEGGRARVAVHDTGSGLRPDQMARLFAPFSRVHDPSLDVPGTGLGLSIAKGIVEQHGGRAWCESDGPGTGSTFLFDLPL